MPSKRRIFQFLAEADMLSRRAALVAVTDVTGASVRNPGAMMAVCEDGSYVGSLSGGCIESAIVAEAQLAIAKGEMRRAHYGAGSPIIDIRLPCGGAVHLLCAPMAHGVAAKISDRLTAREEFNVRLSLPDHSVTVDHDDCTTGWHAEAFNIAIAPTLRIVIFGHGGSVEALVAQARALDCDLHVFTPDDEICNRLAQIAVQVEPLKSPLLSQNLESDRWTAHIFFFHDHDWEVPLFSSVLSRPSLFVGAMGSHITHKNRLAALKANGVSASDRDRIVSPIGLIASSRDPETLALSTLAQVVDIYNQSLAGRI